MTITDTNNKTAPLPRAGTSDVDIETLGALREYLMRKDELAEAKRKAEDARAVLDALAGTCEVAQYAGREAFRYRPGARRGVDLERLAERHREAYEDCLRETPTSTLVIDDEHARLLRQRTWRAAVRRRR